MSVEALWTARFGDISAPGQLVNGGVVVFESGRVLGGDGGSYYVGDYEVDGDDVSAHFTVTVYDPNYGTAFGPLGPKIEVKAVGKRNQGVIAGVLESPSNPSLSIPFELTRRADLP